MTELNLITEKYLLSLPERHWNEESTYDSILLLPSEFIHDSGYRSFVLIGCLKHLPIEIVTRNADDLNWIYPSPRYVSTDLKSECLKQSKAIHFWSREFKFTVGCALSSIYITIKKEN